jgi:hypothetical protein
MKLCLLIPFLAIAACSPADRCRVDDTRCAGAVAQVCGSDERWTDVMNCDEVAAQSGGRWTCQATESGSHACLPVLDDAGAGGAK